MGRIMLQNMPAISFNVELTDVGVGYRITVLMILQFQPACFATELEHAGKGLYICSILQHLNTHICNFTVDQKIICFPLYPHKIWVLPMYIRYLERQG